MFSKKLVLGWLVISVVGGTAAKLSADADEAELHEAYRVRLQPILQERDAWMYAATAAIARLDAQDRLRTDDAPPRSTLWGIGGNIGTYGGNLAPGKMGNLYYDATPGGAADHLFCFTRGRDGAIDEIVYAGTPGVPARHTPCPSP